MTSILGSVVMRAAGDRTAKPKNNIYYLDLLRVWIKLKMVSRETILEYVIAFVILTEFGMATTAT